MQRAESHQEPRSEADGGPPRDVGWARSAKETPRSGTGSPDGGLGPAERGSVMVQDPRLAGGGSAEPRTLVTDPRQVAAPGSLWGRRRCSGRGRRITCGGCELVDRRGGGLQQRYPGRYPLAERRQRTSSTVPSGSMNGTEWDFERRARPGDVTKLGRSSGYRRTSTTHPCRHPLRNVAERDRTVVWYMNGRVDAGIAEVPGGRGPDWRIVGKATSTGTAPMPTSFGGTMGPGGARMSSGI